MEFVNYLRPVGLGAALARAATSAMPETWPAKPIRMIVGFPAGGRADIVARAAASSAIRWRRTSSTAAAAPDGQTLMLAISSHVMNAQPNPTDPYVATKDFAPLPLDAASPIVLRVNPALPANDVEELMALARAQPGRVDYGSPGNGSTQHLFNALMNPSAGIDMTRFAYKGSAPTPNDLMVGDVQAEFTTQLFSQPLLQQGKLKALAATSEKAIAHPPNVTPTGDTSRGQEADVRCGVIAPAGTPWAVIDTLSTEIASIMRAPAMRGNFDARVANPVNSTPERCAAVMDGGLKKWSAVIRRTGIRAD